MEKWSLDPAPGGDESQQYVLSFRGNKRDFLNLVKEFGAKCGRPTRTDSAQGFNYFVELKGFYPDEIERLATMLKEIAPGSFQQPEESPAAPPAPTPITQAPPAEGPALPSLTPPEPAAPPRASPPQAGGPDIPILSSGQGQAQAPFGEQSASPFNLQAPSADAPAPAAPPGPAETQIQAAPFAPPAAVPSGGLPPSDPFAFPVQPPAPVEPPPTAPSPPGQPPVPAAPADSPFVFTDTAAAPPVFPGQAAAPAPTLAQPSALGADSEEAPFPFPTDAPPPLIPTSRPPEDPAAAPGAAPGAAPAPAAPSPAGKPVRPLWGMQDALEEAVTLDTIMVGPFNRFSHAAAASVVGSPGSMYNPLFLFGGAGVGKSHMLKAIGTGLEKALGGSGVFLTSGVKLANAVSRSLDEGKFPEVEKVVGDSKALLVDDVHLLSVSERNQGSLAKLFALFFSKNLQVVLTSLYPARALGALEEALKISLRKGWSVDIKQPSSDPQRDMILGAFTRHGIELTNDEAGLFQERLGSSYGEMLRWVRRFKILRGIQELGGTAAPYDRTLGMLFSADPIEGDAAVLKPIDLEAAQSFAPPAPGADARKLAIMVPKGQEGAAAWAVSRFFAAAAKLGATQSYRPVLSEVYDSDQPFGVPFLIGETCRKAGADVALVVGPPPSSSLTSRVSEFSHAVIHILDSLDILPGWVPFDGIKGDSNYMRAQLDIQGVPE